MRDAMPRTRGVVLRVLDFSTVEAEATESLHGSGHLDAEGVVALGFPPWAMIEHGDHVDVVCCEGVGWEVSDDEPLELPLYSRSPGGFGIFPMANAVLKPAEVRACATDQEIDLADLVRVFGARLESNFWTLHRHLT